VAKVLDLTKVSAEELNRELDATRSQLMAEEANQLLRSILNERRRETVITVDNELMQRFAPERS